MKSAYNDERTFDVDSLELELQAVFLRTVSSVGRHRGAVEGFHRPSMEVVPPRFEGGLAAARLVLLLKVLVLPTTEQGSTSGALVSLAGAL